MSKRVKSNRLSHLAYGEVFPSALEEKNKTERNDRMKTIVAETPLITVKTINRKIFDQILPTRLQNLDGDRYTDLKDNSDGFWKAIGKVLLNGSFVVLLRHTGTEEIKCCFVEPYCRSKQDIKSGASFAEFMDTVLKSLPTIYVS